MFFFEICFLQLEIDQGLDALVGLPLEPECSIAVVHDAAVSYASLV